MVLFMKGVLLYCDIWGKDCKSGDFLKGHIRTVQEGMAPTVQCVLLLIYSIGGVKTYW